MKLYEKLKKIREQQGLTQPQLSELCGIKPQNISRYERGESNLTLDNLNKVLKALNYRITLKENIMSTEIRNEIAAAIIAGLWPIEQFELLDRIESDIYWSWENWEDEILKEFYEGEKPEKPTEKFIIDFCYNEDFKETYGEEREQDLIEWFG